MDLLHIHLLLNHAPVVGGVGAVLLLVAGAVTRSRDITAAGLVATVIVALLALPVFFTGEPAEERVEGLPGVRKEIIERHEDAALQALVALEIAGAAALITLGLWGLRRQLSAPPAFATMAIAIMATVLIARAASLGGEIRHTEIRSGETAPVETGNHDD